MDGKEDPAQDPAGLPRAGTAAPGGSRDDPPPSRAGLRIPPFITRHARGIDDRWPLQDFLELGALVSAVPCARLHTRQVLREWGLGHLGDSAELLVTELIANAVKASREMTRACAVRIWLLSDSAQLLIVVWDASPQPPVLMDATGEAEHGRGLMLVEAVSQQWGWSSCPDGDGKVVWAAARLRLAGESHLRRTSSGSTVPRLLPSSRNDGTGSLPCLGGGAQYGEASPENPDSQGQTLGMTPGPWTRRVLSETMRGSRVSLQVPFPQGGLRLIRGNVSLPLIG
jgi:anti-sigma regulatory factor (Ser/Thr protein kinase)